MQRQHRTIFPPTSPCWLVHILIVSFASLLSLLSASAQLAITEVLSTPSTTGVRRDDFWELTNFGADPIDLTSYWFRDDGGFSIPGAENLAALWAGTRPDEPLIGPGESIILVKASAGVLTTPEDFRQWWGEANLPLDLKVVFYQGHGFNGTKEDVHLWQVTEGQTNLVQLVELFESLSGRSFTYDRLTGVLDTFSAADVEGAFVAAATDDVGSPGVHIGPVSLRIVNAPADADVDGGSPVTLSVRAYGLPPPRYQWRLNGQPIPGATANMYTLAAATSEHAGQYSVELDNGIERLVTTNATISVNTQATCATIVRPLADLDLTPRQTAIFKVETRGYPVPTFRWQLNGVDIPGANASTYSVPGVELGQTGVVTVHVTNPLCSTNTSARFTVSPVPQLIITEAMAGPTNRLFWGHDSWWELTNADTNAVNLRGYRWDDNPPSLEGSVTVTNDVILQPGDSAIFVSSMTPETFRRWWGEDNLPVGLPIITYPGNGLNILSDSIRLWNATALEVGDKIVSLSFVNDQAGVSLLFDATACEFGDEFGCPSVEGERGAFRAAEGGDIGSPGWTSNEQRARPQVTTIQREGSGVRVTWKTQPGRTYELRYRNDLAGSNWTLLRSLAATNRSLTTVDATAGNSAQRFYRVLLVP